MTIRFSSYSGIIRPQLTTDSSVPRDVPRSFLRLRARLCLEHAPNSHPKILPKSDFDGVLQSSRPLHVSRHLGTVQSRTNASGLALMLTAMVTTFLISVALRQKSPRDGHSFVHLLVPSVWNTTAGVGITTFTLCYTLRSLLPSSIIQAVPFDPLEAALFTGLMIGCVFAVITSLIHLELVVQGGRTGWNFRCCDPLVARFIILFQFFHFLGGPAVLWLSATAMVPFVLTGMAAPGLSSITSSSSKSKSKRSSALLGRLGLSTPWGRILGFSLLFLVCVRLMSLVTVCRGGCALLGLGMIGWSIIPPCLDIHVRAPLSNSTSSSLAATNTDMTSQGVVLGYANAYGAPYLRFYLLSFAFVYLCTPLTGQVVPGQVLWHLLRIWKLWMG